jgi:hypothetical protein
MNKPMSAPLRRNLRGPYSNPLNTALWWKNSKCSEKPTEIPKMSQRQPTTAKLSLCYFSTETEVISKSWLAERGSRTAFNDTASRLAYHSKQLDTVCSFPGVNADHSPPWTEVKDGVRASFHSRWRYIFKNWCWWRKNESFFRPNTLKTEFLMIMKKCSSYVRGRGHAVA